MTQIRCHRGTIGGRNRINGRAWSRSWENQRFAALNELKSHVINVADIVVLFLASPAQSIPVLPRCTPAVCQSVSRRKPRTYFPE